MLDAILSPRVLAVLGAIGLALFAFSFAWAFFKVSFQNALKSPVPRNWFTNGCDVLAEIGANLPGAINRALKLAGKPGLFLPTQPADGSAPTASAATIDVLSSENAALREALAALQRRVSESHAVTAPVPFDPQARQTIVPEVVAEVQRAAGSAHPAQIFAPAFFDPTARQTIAPEVTAQIADEALPRDPSQRGSVSLRALLAVVVGLSVVLPVGVALSGCPRLPEVSGCQPEAQTCIGDRPHVCSASQRWHRAGDLSCGAVGGVCTVLGGRAYCAPSADAGVGGDL